MAYIRNINSENIMRDAGIYTDLSITEYHSSEGISSSGITLLIDCPKRYFHKYVEKAPSEPTTAMELGSAVHMLVLEPELFNKTYYLMRESCDLRTKAGKEALAKAELDANGRTIMRKGTWEQAVAMADSIKASATWNKIIPGNVEYSVLWDAGIYNTRLRARPDFYNDTMIVDIKTTDSIKGFSKSIHSYGYHRQAAMQIDGLKHHDGKDRFFGFMVVENKAPYLTACFVLNEPTIRQGRREYLDAAAIYHECMSTGEWPGYEECFQEISIPAYAIQEEELI
jgi:hypothetical protein